MQTQPQNDFPSFPLIDTLDHEILLHRDVHFGGSFEAMRDYYEKEGKGIRPEFTLRRIDELKQLQENLRVNLSDELLFDHEKEEAASAREKYLSLSRHDGDLLSSLIADLILSEEEDPVDKIAAVSAFGDKALPLLIELVTKEDFYNPLFPGYGEAPSLAARCLGQIRDERAIAPLFRALGREDFFMEEAIYDALVMIGEKAKTFLMSAVQTMPFSKENEQAAIALIGFKDDPEIAKVCLKTLLTNNNICRPVFAAYLAMGCHGLKDPTDQAEFIKLSQRPNLSADLHQEMDIIIRKWKKKNPALGK